MVAQPVYAPPPLDILDWKLAERSLRHFVRQAWHVVEPFTTYRHNWHIDAICEHLEATVRGEIRNLVINMPPRSMKSLCVSVMFPAWLWLRRPGARFLYSSYSQALATDHSLATRRVIESGWYQERWGNRFALAGDANLKTKFENDRRGVRLATSVGGMTTGAGGDWVVSDDPHNVKEAESDAIREETLRWWDQVMSTRLNDPKTGVRIIVMQRVHENDLAGHVLEQGGYDLLKLPMEHEETTEPTGIGWTDPRTTPGELLWPERFDAGAVDNLKRALGSYGSAGQLQQRPSPAEGGILKRHHWRFWHIPGQPLPPVVVNTPDGRIECPCVPLPYAFDEEAQSWDMAFKGEDDAKRLGQGKERSYVVGQVWNRAGADVFLRDQVREHLDLPQSVVALEALSRQWPATTAKYVEDKANGPAVIATLQHRVPGLIPVDPQGDKAARARAASPFQEAGNIFLPHPRVAPFDVMALIEEAASYPNGKTTDQVDALTQAVMKLLLGGGLDAVADALGRSLAWQTGRG